MTNSQMKQFTVIASLMIWTRHMVRQPHIRLVDKIKYNIFSSWIGIRSLGLNYWSE